VLHTPCIKVRYDDRWTGSTLLSLKESRILLSLVFVWKPVFDLSELKVTARSLFELCTLRLVVVKILIILIKSLTSSFLDGLILI
jgi:hypothetical protein